jgi:transcriptional regulator with XRE-family HTH domain
MTTQHSYLRTIREDRDISLSHLAKAAGLDKGNLSKLERGLCRASPQTAEQIVAALGDPRLTELHILYPERFSRRMSA